MFKNFECRQVNETEVDVRINGCLEYRLSLLNRTQDCRSFSVARPGRDDFRLDYRWVASFPIISRNVQNTISEAMAAHTAPGGLENVVIAIMKARRMLMKSNSSYLPRLRA